MASRNGVIEKPHDAIAIHQLKNCMCDKGISTVQYSLGIELHSWHALPNIGIDPCVKKSRFHSTGTKRSKDVFFLTNAIGHGKSHRFYSGGVVDAAIGDAVTRQQRIADRRIAW